MSEHGSAHEQRSVERLINFSDAVVAVAVTLLALPLVDIAGPSAGQSVWTVLGDHTGEIYSFLFTFYVVIAMWAVHNRILNSLRHMDGPIMWLNATWLALIVLLPWFSAMYGESQIFSDGGESGDALGVGLLYWGTLAAISMVGASMGWRLRGRPDLAESEDVGRDWWAAYRGPILAAYFLLIGIVSVYAPSAASWLPFGIIPLSILLRPRRRPAPAAAEGAAPASR